IVLCIFFFFSSRRRHTRFDCDWSSDVCSSDLVLGEMLDITDEMAAEEALRASEQLLRRLTEALPMSIVQLDVDRRIVYQNARVRSEERRVGKECRRRW